MASDEGGDAFDDTAHEAGPDRAHGTYVVRVKGKAYAVGLLWNNIDNKATAASEARDVAARPNIDADLYCIRPGGGQYGLGRKSDGHSRGMVSLAGVMASARGGNWMGVFEVDGGYYLLAVRDDDILAQTDVVLGSEIEARSKVDDLIYVAEWDNIYAPASFGIPDSSELDIESNLGKGKGPRLQSVDRVGGMAKLLMGGVILAALVGGGLYYMQVQSDLAAQQILDDLANSFNNEPPVVIPPMPWEGKPQAVSYLAACETALRQAVLTIPGWEARELACQGDSVVMQLTRQGTLDEGGGTINWIRWALDRSDMQSASASPTGDNDVAVSWSIGQTVPTPIDIETPRLADSRRYLQSMLEESFTPVNFPGTTSDDFVATQQFRFVTPFEPTNFASILDKIHGMTIERVSVNLTDLTYTVEGSVYEELEPPLGAINASAP